MHPEETLPIMKPEFAGNEMKYVQECLNSGWVTQGPFVQRFESMFAERHKVSGALATTSCTAALHLAMLALGIGKGDEVIVPAFTWITSANCIEYVGATPVFADVDPQTFNLSPEAFAQAITPRTKAVIPVHLFGLPAEMDAICSIAKKHGIHVVEDAACAAGAEYKGTPVGGFGFAGCFSFHPRKIITTGEGGMVTIQDQGLAPLINSLRNHGATGPPQGADPTKPHVMATFGRLGYNLRMSDIQAAVGVAQLERFDDILQERIALASRYNNLLAGTESIELPHCPSHCKHSFQSYVIRLSTNSKCDRNHVMEKLDAAGIKTRPGTHAVHRLDYYAKKYNLEPSDFPNAAMCEDTSITLPMFPGMKEEHQQRVVSALKEAFAK